MARAAEVVTVAGFDLLTPREAAAELSVSPATLSQWRWRRQGPPYVVVGTRMVRYRREDLRSWLEDRTRHFEDIYRRRQGG